MKIKQTEYKQLSTMLDAVPSAKDRKRYEQKYIDAGLSLMRFRWDSFYTIPFIDRDDWINRMYKSGCLDSHIDTALRKYFGHKS